MPEQLIPLQRGDRVENADYRDALPVNLYSVAKEIKGSGGYLLNHPGIDAFGTGFGVDRGGFYSDKFTSHFRVSGDRFISVSTTGVVTDISGPSNTISGSLDVRFAQSENNVAIVADEKIWYYNPTNGLRRIDVGGQATTFGDPIDIIYINGVFMMTDGVELYHTMFTNEEMVAPDANASAEFLPDGVVGLERQGDNLVVVFGRFSTEYFTSDPTSTFAFRRQIGLSTKVGVVATNAKTELSGTFFVIGGRDYESTAIHAVVSGGTNVISTREIDKILATYARQELLTSSLEGRAEDGDQFIYVHLPNHTLLYNHTVASKAGLENAWTILKTDVVRNDAWNGRHFVFDGRISRWVLGERFGSRIGALNNTISTIYGNEVEVIVYTPFITLDGGSIDEIEIKTISGFTSKVTKTMTSITYDGETYHQERQTTYGEVNQRDNRFIERRFGEVRNQASFKIRCVTVGRINLCAMNVIWG